MQGSLKDWKFTSYLTKLLHVLSCTSMEHQKKSMFYLKKLTARQF